MTIVSINRPHCRNAVDGATARKLFDAFRAFDADAEASVAVFTGTGGYFCAGADHAIALARDIARFPQTCLRADRLSALRQWDLEEEEAIANEMRRTGGHCLGRNAVRRGALCIRRRPSRRVRRG